MILFVLFETVSQFSGKRKKNCSLINFFIFLYYTADPHRSVY